MISNIMLLMVMSFVIFPVYSDNRSENHFYKKYRNYSNKELLQKGLEYSRSPQGKENALICYTIIKNRYAGNPNDKTDIDIALDAMVNLGYLYGYYYFDYEQAYNNLQEAIDLAEENKVNRILPLAYLNMASITLTYYDMYGDKIPYADIFNNYKLAFTTAKAAGNNQVMLLALSNIAEMNFNHDIAFDFTEMINDFKNNKISGNTNLKEYVENVCDAVNAYHNHNYKYAINCLDKAIDRLDAKDSPERYRIIAIKDKAQIYQRLGNYEKAISQLDSALDIALKFEVKDAEVELLRHKADFLRLFNHPFQANECQILYYQKKDSLLSVCNEDGVKNLSFKSQLKKMNDQVKILSAERKAHTILLYSSCAFLIALIAFLVIMFKKNKCLSARNRKLYQNSVESLKKEEEMRRRIHDYESEISEIKTHMTDSTIEESIKYRSSTLTTEDKKNYLAIIEDIMAQSDIICNSSFSINQLAEIAAIPVKAVSQVINETFGHSFKTFLTNYRIKEACRLLNDPETYTTITIETISEKVGFKSRSAFFVAFKRIIGLTPSEYLKEAKKMKN